MSAKIHGFIRHNVLGMVAIFIALSGTAYATHPNGANTISTGDIQEGQVQNGDLGSSAVTGAKVAISSLTGSDVAPSSLTGSDIQAGSILSEDIATGAVGTAQHANSIPAARVTRTGPQNVAHATSTTLNFNSERHDTASMHSNSSNSSRLTAPVAGIYEASASIEWAGANTAGQRSLNLRRNGSVFLASERHSGGEGKMQTLSTVTRLEAGDFVEVLASQTSGSTLTVLDSAQETSPEFSMTWLAPGP